MPFRTNPKKLPAPSGESEYAFHLMGKKAMMGLPGSIVGVIVAGPVAGFIGEATGTAFQTSNENATSAPLSSGADDCSAKKAKPRTKRRRRS